MMLNDVKFYGNLWLVFTLFLFLLYPVQSKGQSKDKLLKSVPIRNAGLLTTDEFGNAYVVGEDNTLFLLKINEDTARTFNRLSYGTLAWVDASNPMRILLFYPQYAKVLLLDNMLSPKFEINLKKLGLFNITAAGLSSDGHIWLYDASDAQLKKMDDRQKIIFSSNDLRQETNTVPRPTSLLEKEGVIYLCDSLNGIYTFNRQARFLNMLPFKGVEKIQVIDDQLLIFKDQQLRVYHMKTFKEIEVELPEVEDIRALRMERNHLFLLFPDRLDIFYKAKQ